MVDPLVNMMAAIPDPIGPELKAFVAKLAAKHAPDVDAEGEWFLDPSHPAWMLAIRWFPGLTRRAIEDDPIMVDQAMREFRMCQACREGDRKPDGSAHTCLLAKEPWEGDQRHPGGSKHFYLVYKRLPYIEGQGQRFEWTKQQCPGKTKRAAQIAELKGTMRDIGGGLMAAEVDDYDAGTRFARRAHS